MDSFSVLLSVYDKESPVFLDKALESIVNQTLLPNEIVLVKDGPLNGALENVITTYLKGSKVPFRIVALKRNVGLGKALQAGVKACSYPWVARMDSDDIALPHRFEVQYAYLRKHPELAILGSWIAEYDEAMKRLISERKPPLTHEALIAFAKRANPFNHMSVWFKKDALLRAGGYLPMEGMEDYYLWIRMFQKGERGANVPQVLVNVRAGKEMIKRRHGWRYFKNELRFAKTAREIGFWSRRDAVRNIAMRGLPRLLPLFLLERLYLLSRKGSG